MFLDIRPKCRLMLCKTAAVKVPFDVTYIFHHLLKGNIYV